MPHGFREWLPSAVGVGVGYFGVRIGVEIGVGVEVTEGQIWHSLDDHVSAQQGLHSSIVALNTYIEYIGFMH